MDKKLKQLENQSLPDLSKMDQHWDDLKRSLYPEASIPKSKANNKIFRWIAIASMVGIVLFASYKFFFANNDKFISNDNWERKPGTNPKTDTLPSIKLMPGKETSTIISKDTIKLRTQNEQNTKEQFIVKAKTTEGKEVELKWVAADGSSKKSRDTLKFEPSKEKTNYPPVPVILKGQTTEGKKIEVTAVPVNDTTNKKQDADKKKALQDFFAGLEKESQSFVVNNKRDTIITGKEGTSLLIPANTFGGSQPLTITMKEYYSYKDMVTNRLTTLSNDQLLVTGGMLHITATINGKEADIQPGKSMRWFVPDTSSEMDEMELFTGQVSNATSNSIGNIPHDTIAFDQNSSINWVSQPRRFSNNFFITRVKVLDLRDEPYKTTYGKKQKGYFYVHKGSELDKNELKAELKKKYPYYDKIVIGRRRKDKEGYKEYVELFTSNKDFFYYTSIGDSAWISPREAKRYNLKSTDTMIYSLNSSTSSLPSSQLQTIASKYSIEITKLGWINCDRFLKNNKPKIDYVVNLNESASDFYTVLVFEKFKSIMPGLIAGNKVVFSGVPEGESAKIISISAKEGKPIAAMQSVQLSQATLTGLKFEETTTTDFKQKAGQMDK
jgi:hypothetical protein